MHQQEDGTSNQKNTGKHHFCSDTLGGTGFTWGALFISFLALWWVTELQRLQKGKTETAAENKKKRVRRKRYKGTRERREETRKRETERESWHCHFRSARQPTLCHHDNGETSYPAGKQGCPGRWGEGKVVMGEKKNKWHRGRRKDRNGWKVSLWECIYENGKRETKVAGVTAVVAKATETVKTLHHLDERNLLKIKQTTEPMTPHNHTNN